MSITVEVLTESGHPPNFSSARVATIFRTLSRVEPVAGSSPRPDLPIACLHYSIDSHLKSCWPTARADRANWVVDGSEKGSIGDTGDMATGTYVVR